MKTSAGNEPQEGEINQPALYRNTPRLPDPEFVSVGFGGQVAMNRVLALLTPDTAPVRRLLHDARDKGLLIDATYGRKTRAVLVLDTGHVLAAALTPDTITGRYQQKQSR
ncbi:MAG: DUF370 domain-containing protein [Chloroflexi bacterium]|uniref:Putative regulatory protein HXX08_05620 n=1 Tax=Candidatus Chlorohelix allophototropha TaxID=3003348 RepID=A0A8T7M179_9CHLR|nr:DUF370 domain-containing protein [Chloroflexota bacterium]WJW67214.1 DUF370 domain-containing protein [Chloroflexota bacterium L227-S17]